MRVAILSTCSFPFTLACPGQYIHRSLWRWMLTIETFQSGLLISLFSLSLSLSFSSVRSLICTPFYLLAILDHAIQSFLAGMSHKDAGISSATIPTPWVLSAGIFAVLSPLLDLSRTCSIPACIPLCVCWFCAISYELCHDYMHYIHFLQRNLKLKKSQYFVFLLKLIYYY